MSDTTPSGERRTNLQFHDHLAYQTLKEHFPELSSQDVFIVVTTTRRLFASGKFPAIA